MLKTINVNVLQAKISKVLNDVQAGVSYEVMRYSEPLAVVLSYEDFLKLRGECKRCIDDLREIAQKAKKK